MVKRVQLLLVALMAVTLSLGVWPAVRAEEAPAAAPTAKGEKKAKEEKEAKTEKTAPQAAVTAPGEKAVPQQQIEGEKKATLTLSPGEKNTYGIDLKNSVPVRGIQFTVNGLKMSEVLTSSRTTGFLAKFNEQTGIVILVSTAADEIPPGAGPVLKIVGEKVPDAEVGLSKIMIADTNRNLIE